MNLRLPKPISKEFLTVQDEFLQEEIRDKGITSIDELTPICEELYLWQGDITTLKVDAIVNTANSGMTGCYVPNHGCIDNCIHFYSGIQLREECSRLMEKQGCEEATGQAKLTPSYNLPCDYIIYKLNSVRKIPPFKVAIGAR